MNKKIVTLEIKWSFLVLQGFGPLATLYIYLEITTRPWLGRNTGCLDYYTTGNLVYITRRLLPDHGKGGTLAVWATILLATLYIYYLEITTRPWKGRNTGYLGHYTTGNLVYITLRLLPGHGKVRTLAVWATILLATLYIILPWDYYQTMGGWEHWLSGPLYYWQPCLPTST